MHFRWEKDKDNLVWLTFDKEGESANTFSRQALEELRTTLRAMTDRDWINAALHSQKLLAHCMKWTTTSRVPIWQESSTCNWRDRMVLPSTKAPSCAR